VKIAISMIKNIHILNDQRWNNQAEVITPTFQAQIAMGSVRLHHTWWAKPISLWMYFAKGDESMNGSEIFRTRGDQPQSSGFFSTPW
jgi:hypothetical protein